MHALFEILYSIFTVYCETRMHKRSFLYIAYNENRTNRNVGLFTRCRLYACSIWKDYRTLDVLWMSDRDQNRCLTRTSLREMNPRIWLFCPPLPSAAWPPSLCRNCPWLSVRRWIGKGPGFVDIECGLMQNHEGCESPPPPPAAAAAAVGWCWGCAFMSEKLRHSLAERRSHAHLLSYAELGKKCIDEYFQTFNDKTKCLFVLIHLLLYRFVFVD